MNVASFKTTLERNLQLAFSVVFLLVGFSHGSVWSQERETPKWQPRITQLAIEYSQGHIYYTPESLERLLSLFEHHLEREPIKHREKLYGYYADLLQKAKRDEKAMKWAEIAMKTPYVFADSGDPKRIWGLAAGRLMRVGHERFPVPKELNYDYLLSFPASAGMLAREAKLSELLISKAQIARRTEKKDMTPNPITQTIGSWLNLNYDRLVEIGDLWLQMGDRDRALHGYIQAHISHHPKRMEKYATSHPHPVWEKIAQTHEQFGDWDNALNVRLLQLCEVRDRGDEQRQEKILYFSARIYELLARIGADEKVEKLAVRYDVTKLEKIVDTYLRLSLPNLAEPVIDLIEKSLEKQRVDLRARMWEVRANTVAYFTSKPYDEGFLVVIWGEVWTHDKIIALQKEAIEWGKKAGWKEERIKKLETQIEKLPDLLKYVREPKNLKEILSGKAKEPVWE
jgi:tetratricopeptide (TPR) repeat protein